jgi:hypothetical protein
MADLNFSLLPWQQSVYADKTRFKVVVAGRRCGKSRLAVTTLLIEGLSCPCWQCGAVCCPDSGTGEADHLGCAVGYWARDHSV